MDGGTWNHFSGLSSTCRSTLQPLWKANSFKHSLLKLPVVFQYKRSHLFCIRRGKITSQNLEDTWARYASKIHLEIHFRKIHFGQIQIWKLLVIAFRYHMGHFPQDGENAQNYDTFCSFSPGENDPCMTSHGPRTLCECPKTRSGNVKVLLTDQRGRC